MIGLAVAGALLGGAVLPAFADGATVTPRTVSVGNPEDRTGDFRLVAPVIGNPDQNPVVTAVTGPTLTFSFGNPDEKTLTPAEVVVTER